MYETNYHISIKLIQKVGPNTDLWNTRKLDIGPAGSHAPEKQEMF
jgi:hypothetical protein